MPKEQKLNFKVDPEDINNFSGFEDMDASKTAIPWLKIAQELTPECKKTKPQYIEELELGQLFNSVSKEIYGNEVWFICLGFQYRWVEWKPDRGGFVRDHSEQEYSKLENVDTSKFGKYKTDEGNDLVETYNYVGFIADRPEHGPIIFSLSSTSIKIARQWNSQMLRGTIPDGKGGYMPAKPYHFVWSIKTALHQQDKNDWFVPVITKLGPLQSQEQYDLVIAERQNIPNYRGDYAQIAESVGNDTSNSQLAKKI